MKYLAMLSLCSLSFLAQADYTLDFVESSNADDIKQMLIADGKIRMSTGSDEDMLFDSKQQALIVMIKSRKEFSVMDETYLKRLKDQMDQIHQQMEAQLAQVPPSQRPMMERMMRSMAPPKPDTITHQRGSASKNIGGFSCQVWQQLRNGKADGELCLASRSTLGMSKADMETYRSFARFQARMMAAMANHEDHAGLMALAEEDSLPIAYNSSDSQVRVKSGSSGRIDADRLSIPKNWKRLEMELPDEGQE